MLMFTEKGVIFMILKDIIKRLDKDTYMKIFILIYMFNSNGSKKYEKESIPCEKYLE